MRDLRLGAGSLERIRRHARDVYPDECCGFLIAKPDPGDPSEPRTVVSVEPAANEFEGERRRRFVIAPRELRDAERRHDGTDRMVAGFYHSHPDHPARPSQFDQDHAWPWYTYLVLSVTADATPALGAFELDEPTRQFREVRLEVVPPPDPRVTESL